MNSNIHVDAELLAAWSEGSLPRDEAAKVELHLASCERCQEVLAAFARTEPPAPVAVPLWQRWRLGWAVPIAVAASAAAIWIAAPRDRGVDEFERTIAPAISEPTRPEQSAPASAAAPPVAPPDAARRKAASEATSEAKQRRDEAPAPPQDQAANERFADAVSSARAAEPKERDQDRKAEAPRAAEGRQAAAAPTVPAPAQEESRQRVEAQSGLLRQTPVTEAVSPDPLIRWRIPSARRLERSADGGKTWTVVTLPQQVTPTGVVAPTASTAIVTADDGRQFRTVDQGKTWNLVQP